MFVEEIISSLDMKTRLAAIENASSGAADETLKVESDYVIWPPGTQLWRASRGGAHDP